MKKIVSVILAIMMLLCLSGGASASKIELYALDGRTIRVPATQKSAYLQRGWYADWNETVATIYATDGRSRNIYKAEVPTYLSLGWYANRDETVVTIYAPDGRRKKIYKDEVETYLELGWYASYEETVETLYAYPDKSIVVYKTEVPAYLALGWSRTKEKPKMIALTFDDGPHSIHTASVLDTLERYDAKASFFVLGSNASINSQLVQRAHNMGCDVGNHTYTHPNLNKCTARKIRAEINDTRALLQRLTGENPPLFRPPYGNHNATVRASAGTPLILWNIDTLDWKSRNAQKVADHVLANASDGDIVLMHDIYASTADAVKIIVPELIARGYQLVTVRELAAAKGISLQNGNIYYGF